MQITSVRKRRRVTGRFMEETVFAFIVGIGESSESELVTVEVFAAELLSYTAFKTAVLKKSGVCFIDFDIEESRRANMEWASIIESWINKAELVEA